MTLFVFQSSHEVRTIDELRARLNERHQGEFGAFWLQHDSGSKLALVVRGEDAYATYFPADAHPGFHRHRIEKERSEAPVEFLADNFEATPIDRALVMPTGEALTIVEDFFVTGERPKELDFEL